MWDLVLPTSSSLSLAFPTQSQQFVTEKEASRSSQKYLSTKKDLANCLQKKLGTKLQISGTTGGHLLPPRPPSSRLGMLEQTDISMQEVLNK